MAENGETRTSSSAISDTDWYSSPMNHVGLPFPALVDLYIRSRATRKDSDHTTSRYRTELLAIAKLVAEKAGVEIDVLAAEYLTPTAISEAFATYASTRSKSSVAGCCSTWRGFGRWLVREGVARANPAEHLDRPQLPRPTPKSLIGGTSTVYRLLESVRRGDRPARRPWPQRDLAMVAIFAAAGLRRDEAARLNVNDVDITDSGCKLRVSGKGGEQRWVPVGMELVPVIAEYQQTRMARFPTGGRSVRPGDHDPLLVNDDGRRFSGRQMYWLVQQCYKAAGIAGQVPRGAMVHALRHTYATLLAEQGAAATDLQGLLGHRSLNTSQLYISVTDTRLRSVAELSPALGALREDGE